jgi:hypothetical protein
MLLIFSGIPFVLIQCMPGKKSFAVVAAILLALMAYGYYDIHKPIVNDMGDGPGAVLGMIFFYFICYGIIAGLTTKAITLYMAARNVSRKKRMLVRCVGLLLIACFAFAPSVLNVWKHRAPSSSCNHDIVTFAVDGQKFQVPGVGIVTANAGDGKPTSNVRNLEHFYAFHGAPSYRKFCSDFNNGKTPASVNAINIDLGRIARTKMDPNFPTLCKQARWPNEICDYASYSSPEGYPSEVGIYNKLKFNASFMGGGWDYPRIAEEMQKAAQPSDVAEFSFDGHYYYWIDKTQTERTHEPFALKCHKSNQALYCQTDERWSGNVYITYGMPVGLENPINDAKRIRETTLNFVKQLNLKD